MSNKAFIILPPQPKAKKVLTVTPTASNTATTPSIAKNGAASVKPVGSAPAVVSKDQKKPTANAASANKKDNNSTKNNKDGKDKKDVQNKKAAPVTDANAYDFSQFSDKKKAAVVWWKSYDAKTATTLLMDPEQAWFEQYPEFTKDEKKGKNNFHPSFDASKLKEVEDVVAGVYEHQVSLYKGELAKLGVSSDQKWLNSVIDSGTWSDKIAAMALKVQESPFYNLEALDLLIGIATKKDLRTAYTAIEAIKDLLLNNLLPDRVLVDFGKTPYFYHEDMSMKCAVLNWFEFQLRRRVVQVLEVLETGLKSNIFFFRRQGLELAMDMLTKKPEQESKLLSLIVNKLGDADGRVSSKTSELMKQLLNHHPAMKSVVIREVRMFIYRSNVKLSAIFTAVNYLTQIKLGPGDAAVALQLAECFLSLFEKALQAKEEGSRLLTVLLNGINKSFPYLEDIGPLNKYLDSIFRLVHTAGSFSTSTQALVLISSIVFASAKNTSSANETEESVTIRNRFYITLYSKLLSDDAITKAKNSIFLNLLYRSVKNDPSLPRAKAFLKRIAICATETGAAVTAGLLFMISEVLAHRPALKAMLTDAELADIEAKLEHIGEDEDDDVRSIANESTMTIAEHHLIGCYDAAKRNPLFACLPGQSPSLYELSLLRHHYHPSTKAFANALLAAPEHGISFSGDPLVEFSTMSFLNRFAYKNPKQNIADNLKQQSTQPQEEPVNLVFTQGDVDASTIAPEKHFFYKFFGERDNLRAMGKSKDRKKKKQDDDEFNSDDEDNSVDMGEGRGGEEREEMTEEDEIDRFADKLAQDLMKHDAASRGDDFGDFSDDDEDDDEEFGSEPEDYSEGDEEDEGNSSKKRKSVKESVAFDFEDFKAEQSQKSKKQKVVVEEEDEDEDDDEDEEEPEMYMGSDDEDDDDEEGEFPAFLDDADLEDEEEEEEVVEEPKSKKGKKKAKGGDDDFADAADYEDQMDEIVQAYRFETPAAKIAKAMHNKQPPAQQPVMEEKATKAKKGSVKFAADVKPAAVDKKQKNKKLRR